MKKELAMKWIEALRSGNYKQGKQFLNKNEKYCCLGVLCEIEGLLKRTDVMSGATVYFSDDRWLTKALASYPGKNLRSSQGIILSMGTTLATLNDTGRKFAEIANIIEKHWEEL